jgi:hypothetical protein
MKKRESLKKYISRIMMRHKDLDKSESAKKKQAPFKKTMGDDRERRSKSIRKLDNKLKKLDKFLELAEPKKGVSGEEVKTNVTDPESANMKSSDGYIQGFNGISVADSANQIVVAAEAIGSGPESGCFPEMLDSLEENMKEITGKENPLKKSLLTADTGFFSEGNLQEAARRKINVLIPDQQFRQRDPHFTEKKNEKVPKKRFTLEDFMYDQKGDCYICPSGQVLEYKYDVTLRNNSGKQYRAKRGICVTCPLFDKCISVKAGKNPVRTIYIINKKYEDNLSEKMRQKIDDPAYRELYSRRMQIIEPVFANMAYCKGMDRFTYRSQKKVNTQWLLFNIVHNLSKCTKPLMALLGL